MTLSFRHVFGRNPVSLNNLSFVNLRDADLRATHDFLQLCQTTTIRLISNSFYSKDRQFKQLDHIWTAYNKSFALRLNEMCKQLIGNLTALHSCLASHTPTHNNGIVRSDEIEECNVDIYSIYGF